MIARQQRGGADWYLGALTNAESRSLAVPLSFLDPGRRYQAQIYADGAGADWKTNPYALAISRQTVTAGDTLVLRLAPGGGAAIRFQALAER